MANRNEFSRAVKRDIAKRAERPTGFQCEAEGCGLIVARGEIHHVNQDAMELDKKRKLTAEDGLFLCKPCHDAISGKQQTVLAKVLRQEADHLRIVKPPEIQGGPMATTERAAKRRANQKPPVANQGGIFARIRTLTPEGIAAREDQR